VLPWGVGTARPLLRVLAIPLALLIALAALVPCPCPTLPEGEAGQHGCCVPEAGIQAAREAGACCPSMHEASPGLSAPGAQHGPAPALAAAPRFDPLPSRAWAGSPRRAFVATSPPPVLRI
jgi:hypothetical protein